MGEGPLADGTLTEAQVADYRERGWIVQPGMLGAGELAVLADAATDTEGAHLLAHRAVWALDTQQPDAARLAGMALLFAAETARFATDRALQYHGGYGFAEEYDVERKYREARLYQVAPISTNLVLSYVAEHVLGMPRSY